MSTTFTIRDEPPGADAIPFLGVTTAHVSSAPRLPLVDLAFTITDTRAMPPHVRAVYLGSGGNSRQRRTRRRAAARYTKTAAQWTVTFWGEP